MASVNENIAKAMDVLISKRLGSLAMDQTIIAEITEVVNSAKGHYKIRYQNVIVDVYSENTDKVYKTGDTVYVKIANGDFSAKKMIEGKASSDTSLLESQIQNLKNYLIPVSPVIKVNFNNAKEIGLIAGISGSLEINSFTYDIQNFSILSNLYDIVQIEAKFRTAFSSDSQNGNYGIKIKFNLSEEEDIEYILDTSSFRGNFYNYNSGAIQTVQLQIPKGTLKSIDSIIFFENMEKDGENSEKANIFVENINISFLEAIDFTEYEYYLYVNALQGYEFTENINLLQYQARCLRKGEDISEESEYQIYWYKKNAPSDGKTYAGSNWALIETKDQNANEYLDNNILCVNKVNDISNSLYKVILKDEEDLFLEKEFTVYNTKIQLPKILQKTNLQEKTTSLFLENNPNNYTTLWESNGQKITKDKDSEGKEIEQITIKNSDFTSNFLEIICYFYQNKNYIGNTKYLLAPVEEDKDIDVIFDGIEFYQYDVNGDIFLEDALREKLLRVQVQAKEGYAAQIANTTYSIGDTIIRNQASNPENSMLQEVWVDSENNIHYKISSTYSLSKINNTIKVTIKLINGKELSFSKSIVFSKVGNLGTNNSNYTMSLEPAYGLVAYNNFGDNYSIKIKIYYQGKEIKSSEIQEYDIQLKEIDISGTKIDTENIDFKDIFKDNNGIYTIGFNDLTQIKEVKPYKYNASYDKYNIVSLPMENGLLEFYQANQQITENSQQLTDGEGKIIQNNLIKYWTKKDNEIVIFGGNYISITIKINNNVLTSYLTIPGSVQNNTNKEKNDIYLSELMLPQSIRYSSSGDRPQYYSKNENKGNKISKEIFTPFSLQPEYYFDFDKANGEKYYVGGVVQITTLTGDIIYWPIIYYLNSYGNNTINNWDGEEIILSEGEILANQIIAGRKDKETNEFTGVAIGEVKQDGTTFSGIYGYSEGINTFGLRSDGTAYFGKGGGIQIKGDEAKIYGRGFNDDAIMILNLTGSSNDKAIQIGENFWVDYSGNAYLSGEIHATKGNIGGWNIDNDGISATLKDNEWSAAQITPRLVQFPGVAVLENNRHGRFGAADGSEGNSVIELSTQSGDAGGPGGSTSSMRIRSDEYLTLKANNNITLLPGGTGQGSYTEDAMKAIILPHFKKDWISLYDYIQELIQDAISKIPSSGGGTEDNAIN